MRFFLILPLFFILVLSGCETAHKATTAGGSVLGKGADVVGGISEGGAEALQGETTPEENPYNR